MREIMPTIRAISKPTQGIRSPNIFVTMLISFKTAA
jgi:hypothetical protein